MNRHANIPIFIPHMGCPHTCAFCNQRSIAGKSAPPTPEQVEQLIDHALSTLQTSDVEIAFFGGSFTGIDRRLMTDLLSLAQRYADNGRVNGIRLSTRPDYISPEILDILDRYSITAVELGIQSLSDTVLAASGRGHTAAQSLEAIRLLTHRGIPCVGQMMLGLPSSTPEHERFTARTLCASGISAARIYPTVVLRGTGLADMTARGDYSPLSLEEAVERSADLAEIFHAYHIPLLRIGLCSADNLSGGDVVAGPWHPALGELVYSRLCLRRMRAALSAFPHTLAGKSPEIACPKGWMSKFTGQKGENRRILCEEFRLKSLKIVENDTIFGYNCTVRIIE